MMRRSFLLLLICLPLAACVSGPKDTQWKRLSAGQRRVLNAVIMAGEEGGSGATAAGIRRYPYQVARAMGYGTDDDLAVLFSASVHTDAAASEMQGTILATVLDVVGDEKFARALQQADLCSRASSLRLLQPYFSFGGTYGIYLDPRKYPSVYMMLRQP